MVGRPALATTRSSSWPLSPTPRSRKRSQHHFYIYELFNKQNKQKQLQTSSSSSSTHRTHTNSAELKQTPPPNCTYPTYIHPTNQTVAPPSHSPFGFLTPLSPPAPGSTCRLNISLDSPPQCNPKTRRDAHAHANSRNEAKQRTPSLQAIRVCASSRQVCARVCSVCVCDTHAYPYRRT